MDQIKIRPSRDADTRTAVGPIDKKTLYGNTISHINDVVAGCRWFAEMLVERSYDHDITKRYDIDQFYADFSTGATGEAFKALPWWQIHLLERHHLNDRVPEDVNLFDVVEMLIDCCVAGMARSGSVYEVTIPDQVLRDAVKNTVSLITESIVVEDKP